MNRLCIEGQLLAPAVNHRYANGLCSVVVLIDQPGLEPILAERAFGSSPSASYASANAARSMAKGCKVVVHGFGLKRARWQGRSVLRLQAVDHIEHPSALPHSEPLAAQAA